MLLMSSMLLILPLGCSCSQTACELSIFAAAGARAAVDEVCQRFEEQSGIRVSVTYGGGGEVLSQMLLAKSGDVYIAPEQSFMEKAIAEGAVDAETVSNIAYMIPVIAVPKGNPENINSLADLARPGLQIAISRPETTLVGQYALEIFQKAGLSEAVGPNIVTYAANPNILLTMLIMGQVDAIITWHYYAYLNPDDIENIYLPAEQVTGIAEMQIAVSAYSKNPRAAQEYVDFVASEEGKAIFAEYSYIIDEEEVAKYQQ
jgi:molybdate transport system substrate-binding protein